MDDQIANAVKTAKSILSTEEQWRMICAFIFGSFTSAIWVLRQNTRSPKVWEITSTALCSGFIAIAVCNLLNSRANLSLAQNIGISILTGFSGDILIRILVERFIKWIAKIFGVSSSSEKEENNDDKK
jgi:predicted membrane channel-forming protein YqfA (hemolysin III family)